MCVNHMWGAEHCKILKSLFLMRGVVFYLFLRNQRLLAWAESLILGANTTRTTGAIALQKPGC